METKEVKTRESKPRDVFFVCVTMTDDQPIVSTIKIGTKVSEDKVEEGVLLVEPLVSHITMDESTGKPKMIATDEQLRQLAVKSFANEFGADPEFVRGPFYERKGMAIQQSKPGRRRRATLQVDLEKINYANDKALAHYNEWVVTAMFLQNPEECIANYQESDGRAAMISFKEPLVPSAKGKVKPNPRYVFERDLEKVVPL